MCTFAQNYQFSFVVKKPFNWFNKDAHTRNNSMQPEAQKLSWEKFNQIPMYWRCDENRNYCCNKLQQGGTKADTNCKQDRKP